MQTNAHVGVGIIGNLAGDKAILLGCTLTGGGTQRSEGYVFLRTKDHPEGEVLYWEGGPISGGPQTDCDPGTGPGVRNIRRPTSSGRWLRHRRGESKWADFREAQSLPGTRSADQKS